MRTMLIHRSAIIETKHAAHLLVELTCGVFAFLYGLQIGTGEIIAVVGVGGAPAQSVGPGAELHIKTILHGLIGVVSATPVAYYHTIKLPICLQNLIESVLIMTIMLIAIEIVCTHNGPGLTLLYCSLEGWQIDFVKSTVAHLDIDLVAIFLIVVQTIVLHAR